MCLCLWMTNTITAIRWIRDKCLPVTFVQYEALIENPLPVLKSLCSIIGRGQPEYGVTAIDKRSPKTVVDDWSDNDICKRANTLYTMCINSDLEGILAFPINDVQKIIDSKWVVMNKKKEDKQTVGVGGAKL